MKQLNVTEYMEKMPRLTRLSALRDNMSENNEIEVQNQTDAANMQMNFAIEIPSTEKLSLSDSEQ